MEKSVVDYLPEARAQYEAALQAQEAQKLVERDLKEQKENYLSLVGKQVKKLLHN